MVGDVAAWQGGNGSTNAYRYAGEYGYYRDGGAVQYVRARYLNVLQGRWMSADQIMTIAGDQLNRSWQDFHVLLTPTLVTEALVVGRPFVDNDTP